MREGPPRPAQPSKEQVPKYTPEQIIEKRREEAMLDPSENARRSRELEEKYEGELSEPFMRLKENFDSRGALRGDIKGAIRDMVEYEKLFEKKRRELPKEPIPYSLNPEQIFGRVGNYAYLLGDESLQELVHALGEYSSDSYNFRQMKENVVNTYNKRMFEKHHG